MPVAPPLPAWARSGGQSFDSILENSPVELSGTLIARMYKEVQTDSEFRAAEAVYLKYKSKFVNYEKLLDCDSYAGREVDIATSIVEDVVKRPISLMIAVGALIKSVAAQDEDEALDALMTATIELGKLVAEEAAGKVIDSAVLKKAVAAFKEALLYWLQSYSKRSRKYFMQIIDDIVHLTGGIAGLALTVGNILLTPSAIAPDACGSVRYIEALRSAALARVFSKHNASPTDFSLLQSMQKKP